MPIPASRPPSMPASLNAARPTETTDSQSSRGSCSTRPGAGKCWPISADALARTRPSSSRTRHVVPVVPWSIARITRGCYAATSELLATRTPELGMPVTPAGDEAGDAPFRPLERGMKLFSALRRRGQAPTGETRAREVDPVRLVGRTPDDDLL